MSMETADGMEQQQQQKDNFWAQGSNNSICTFFLMGSFNNNLSPPNSQDFYI